MKDNKPEIFATALTLAVTVLMKVFDATSLSQSIVIFLVTTSVIIVVIQNMKFREIESKLKDMNSIGIKEVNKPHTEMDLKKQLGLCKKSFIFWGVSARTVINQDGSSIIRSKYFENPNVTFRFLLLDPREDEIGRKRAKEETGNEGVWISWKNIISGSIEDLSALKNEIPKIDLEIRIYKSTPIFRMLEIDNSDIYLNFYCSNVIPTDLPNLHLIKKTNSFYYAIEKSFEETWAQSEVILDKNQNNAIALNKIK